MSGNKQLEVGKYYKYESEYFKVLAMEHPNGPGDYYIKHSTREQDYAGKNSKAVNDCIEVSVLEGMLKVGE